FFFFSSRRRHTRFSRDWSSDVCSSDLTGRIEVDGRHVEILSRAGSLPFGIDDRTEVDEAVRLRHRALDLRRPVMQRNIIMRHKAAQAVRGFLNAEGCLEIETTMLTRSTPAGARD